MRPGPLGGADSIRSMLRWSEPFSVALALRDEPGLVLLESRPGFGDLGRRSFIAAGPREVATGGLHDLERRAAARSGAERWFGWLSYDLGREIEDLPVLAADELDLPPLALGRYDTWLEFDHVRRSVSVGGEGDATHLVQALAGAGCGAPPHRSVGAWTSSLPRMEYEHAVRRAVDYIEAGDVFQVNLSQRLA